MNDERCNLRKYQSASPTSPSHHVWTVVWFQHQAVGCGGACPDTTSLTQSAWPGAHSTLPSPPTPALQMPLFSDTIFIVSAVGGDGSHCCCRRRLFLGFLLYSTTLGGGSTDRRAFGPPLRACPHLLGGKAWISPFPPSLPLKHLLSPSHLAPLLISSPPGKPLSTFIQKRHLPRGLTCSLCPPALVLRLPKGQ